MAANTRYNSRLQTLERSIIDTRRQLQAILQQHREMQDDAMVRNIQEANLPQPIVDAIVNALEALREVKEKVSSKTNDDPCCEENGYIDNEHKKSCVVLKVLFSAELTTDETQNVKDRSESE